MSTRGQFNTKNPTIKRICKLLHRCVLDTELNGAVKEASELSLSPSADYHAEPQETNLFEWHFTIRGPPAPSAYAGGLYHGRIILPPQYPLRPPSFRFLTPTGRFEVNREICLSISGHHEETWQPAWGVRTALVAIRSFMDTDAKGQLGGIECTKDARERMARDSAAWKCAACGKSNADVMAEREELVKEIEAKEGRRKEDHVPEELRLAYRDELAKDAEAKAATPPPQDASDSAPSSVPAASAVRASPPPSRPRPSVQHVAQRTPDRSTTWVDTCIYGLVAALLFMVLRKFS